MLGELLLQGVAVAGGGAEGEIARDDQGVVGLLDFVGEQPDGGGRGQQWKLTEG